MNYAKRLLLANRAWSQEAKARDPGFFERLAQGQQPRVLWIGCSDSRVPAEGITNAQPGELFVHRNIANLYTSDDGNTSSVVEYAVHALGVEHIVICGHHHCGGVRAALSAPSGALPAVNRRIAGLRQLAHRHRNALNAIDEFEARVDRLVELNVIEQVRLLRESPILSSAARKPTVHGWVFGLREGLLTPLTDFEDAPHRASAAIVEA
ncbi:carbonic anhydrase [Trinickia dabaoshanensis]|uniref:Carbonic anhydrase n=1 Tax=Trinickia dabaoshanensis TaxID=564714 RepID=A0A2N7VKL5_9BURK|nr:carbonic anhydrase [Trinickia dabaoshanensis]PMS17686.1 carbonic anhydrase [Trinickia dabaoshanensis]